MVFPASWLVKVERIGALFAARLCWIQTPIAAPAARLPPPGTFCAVPTPTKVIPPGAVSRLATDPESPTDAATPICVTADGSAVSVRVAAVRVSEASVFFQNSFSYRTCGLVVLNELMNSA